MIELDFKKSFVILTLPIVAHYPTLIKTLQASFIIQNNSSNNKLFFMLAVYKMSYFSHILYIEMLNT